MSAGISGEVKKKWDLEKVLFALTIYLTILALILWQIYQPSPDNKNTDLSHASLVILIYLTTIFTIVFRANSSASSRPLGEQSDSEHVIYFGLILGLGLILRLTMCTVFQGFPNDISAFKSWALLAGQNLPGFYTSGVWSDYPPGYIYILAIVGKIATLTGLGTAANQNGFLALIKIPSMITDLFMAYFIYKLAASKEGFKNDRRMQLFVMALVVFNPVIFLVSTIWGQVDILLTLVITAALYYLMKKKFIVSSVFYALAVLIKPQGLLFLPVLAFALIKAAARDSKSIKIILKCAIAGFGTFIIGIIPFSTGQQPLWIVVQYLSAMGGYTGATVNAFNLYAMFGLNWVDDSKTFIFISYLAWGLIFTIAVLAFAGYLYARDKGNPAMPFIAALVMITGIFNLSSRMHERYIFPALILTLVIYIILKEKKYLYLFGLMTVTQFINYIYVFIAYQRADSPMYISSPAVTTVSLTSLILMVCVMAVSRSTVLGWSPPGQAAIPASAEITERAAGNEFNK